MKTDEVLSIIDKVLSECLNKPKHYHFVCHAGSTVGPLVDFWKDEPTSHCGNSGDGTNTEHGGGWINAPACKRGCDRQLKGIYEISEREQTQNFAMNELAQSLRVTIRSNSDNKEENSNFVQQSIPATATPSG